MPPPRSLIDLARRWDTARPAVMPRPLDRAGEWWAARGPRVRALAVVVVALLGVLGTAAVVRGRDPGPHVEVWVATDVVEPGGEVAGAVTTARRPQAHLPPDVVAASGPVVGRTTSRLLPGQVVTATHLLPDLTDALADDQVALAVSAGRLPPVPAGVPVDVLSRALDGTGRILATRAVVLSVSADWVWLAVPAAAAADVAAADGDGRLSLARRRQQPPADVLPPRRDAAP